MKRIKTTYAFVICFMVIVLILIPIAINVKMGIPRDNELTASDFLQYYITALTFISTTILSMLAYSHTVNTNKHSWIKENNLNHFYISEDDTFQIFIDDEKESFIDFSLSSSADLLPDYFTDLQVFGEFNEKKFCLTSESSNKNGVGVIEGHRIKFSDSMKNDLINPIYKNAYYSKQPYRDFKEVMDEIKKHTNNAFKRYSKGMLSEDEFFTFTQIKLTVMMNMWSDGVCTPVSFMGTLRKNSDFLKVPYKNSHYVYIQKTIHFLPPMTEREYNRKCRLVKKKTK